MDSFTVAAELVSDCLSTASEGCFGFFFTTFFVLDVATSFGAFTCFTSCAFFAVSVSALCIFSCTWTSCARFFTVIATFFTGNSTFFVGCVAEADADVGAVIGNTFGFADTLAFGLTVSVLAILPVSKLLAAVLMVLALLMILDVLSVLATVDVDVLRRSGLSAMNARIFFMSNGALDGSLALIGASVS